MTRLDQCSGLVVLLAGRSGTGKSSLAPLLAGELGAVVLESDELFDLARTQVGAALGIGPDVVNEPIWAERSHPRLVSLLLGLASTAASGGRPIVAVSPFSAYRGYPGLFAADSAALATRWAWVVLDAPGEVCRQRIERRGWAMDAAKLADWAVYDRACRELAEPWGALVVDTSAPARSYPELAKSLAAGLRGDPGLQDIPADVPGAQ